MATIMYVIVTHVLSLTLDIMSGEVWLQKMKMLQFWWEESNDRLWSRKRNVARSYSTRQVQPYHDAPHATQRSGGYHPS